MLGQWDRFGRRLPFETTDRCSVRILWVCFSGERTRIETTPIIKSVPTFISSGKTKVIYGNE
jgi:hypothetical protein